MKKSTKPIFHRLAPWLLAAMLFFVGFLPYLEAFRAQDENHVFWGYLHYPEDMDSYASWMTQSAKGAWLFSNPYQTSPRKGEYFNALWLVAGKLQGLSGLDFAVMFQILRFAAALALVMSFWFLLRALDFEFRDRIGLSLLFCFAGGFGWLHTTLAFDAPIVDTYTELFPFFQTTLVPHAALAHAVLLAAFGYFLLGKKTGSTQYYVLAGMSLFALGCFRAYDLLVAWLACGLALALWSIWKTSRPSRKHMAWVMLPAIPCLMYNAWLSRYSSGFSIWSKTNDYPAPSPEIMALGLGLPLILGIAGVVWLILKKRFNVETLFLFAWLSTGLILMFSGIVPWSWRTCAAFTTPYFIACGLLLKNRLNSLKSAALWGLLLILTIPSSIEVLNEKFNLAFEQDRYYFQAPEILEAIRWLDQNRPEAIVLTHGHISLKIPAFSSARVLLGHKDLTEDFRKKRMDYHTIVNSYEPEKVSAMLNRYGVDTILWGPLDRRYGNFSPASMPEWTKIYRNPLVSIYGKIKQ